MPSHSGWAPAFLLTKILHCKLRSVKLDRLFIDQIENDELIVTNLHDGGNGFVRIFRELRIGVVHFKK